MTLTLMEALVRLALVITVTGGCLIRDQADLEVVDDRGAVVAEVAFEPTAIGGFATTVVHIVNHSDLRSLPFLADIVGRDREQFQVGSVCAASSVLGNGRCDLTIDFVPARAGGSGAVLLIYGDPDGPIAVAVTGLGIAPSPR